MELIEPLRDKNLFFLDGDGVLWMGNRPIHGASRVIKFLRERGLFCFLLTNNSTKSRVSYVEKLQKLFGEKFRLDEVLTSAYGAALYLKEKGANRVFVIGESGLKEELSNADLKVVDEEDNKSVDFVVVGLDRGFNYSKLSTALKHLYNGAELLATNDDPFLVTEKFPIPGAGALVSAVEICSGRKALTVIGKPNPFLIRLGLEKAGIKPEEAVCVGDRITTDIKAGKAAGIFTVFVRTGTGKSEEHLINETKPNLVLNSIADLMKD